MTDKERLINDISIVSEIGIHHVMINGKPVTGIRNVTIQYEPRSFPLITMNASPLNTTSLVIDKAFMYLNVGGSYYRLQPVDSIEDDMDDYLREVNEMRVKDGLEPIDRI